MMNVFVSSECVDDAPIADLILRLRQEGFMVAHSPRNPADGGDVRWPTWYESGCQEAISQANVFIIGITPGWDASCWMCIEAEEMHKAQQKGWCSRMYHYNPAQTPVRSDNMSRQYLHERLPDDAGAAAHRLKVLTKGN